MPSLSGLLHASSPHHSFLRYLSLTPHPRPGPPLLSLPQLHLCGSGSLPSLSLDPNSCPRHKLCTGGTEPVASHSCLFLKKRKNLLDMTRPGFRVGEGATTSDLQDGSIQCSRLHQPDPQLIHQSPGTVRVNKFKGRLLLRKKAFNGMELKVPLQPREPGYLFLWSQTSQGFWTIFTQMTI